MPCEGTHTTPDPLLTRAAPCGQVLVGGVGAGLAVKAHADRQRRMRLMRFIEEGGDGQGPFVSEVRQAITS